MLTKKKKKKYKVLILRLFKINVYLHTCSHINLLKVGTFVCLMKASFYFFKLLKFQKKFNLSHTIKSLYFLFVK